MFDGSQEGIFFSSPSTAVAHEIGWDFVSLVLASKISFSAFCQEKTRFYQTNNPKSAKFLSRTTFLNWFFAWIVGMKVDFREQIDDWCGHHPKVLAADGTHVGVSKLHETLEHPITAADMALKIKPAHKRY